MSDIQDLLDANKQWAGDVVAKQPEHFAPLAEGQSPEYLWIGCSDSRVPANQVVGRLPGEMFVHRNIANQVKYSDLNCQSVIQYAVDVLKVKHIIVCGHYGCGGVMAATKGDNNGIVDEWLRAVKDMLNRERETIEAVTDADERFRLLCDLNVKEQVANVARLKTIQLAWLRGQELSIHGWVYDIKDGHINNLDVTITGQQDIDAIYRLNP